MAPPVKNASGLDAQAGSVDFAGNYPLGLDLHAALGKNHTVKPATHHHVVPFNLTFHFGVFTQDEALAGDDVSLRASAPLRLCVEVAVS